MNNIDRDNQDTLMELEYISSYNFISNNYDGSRATDRIVVINNTYSLQLFTNPKGFGKCIGNNYLLNPSQIH